MAERRNGLTQWEVEVGMRLNVARRLRGLTLRQFHDRLTMPISQDLNTIRHVEKGRRSMTLGRAEDYASALELTVADLLFGLDGIRKSDNEPQLFEDELLLMREVRKLRGHDKGTLIRIAKAFAKERPR